MQFFLASLLYYFLSSSYLNTHLAKFYSPFMIEDNPKICLTALKKS
jgi:hypothetical protein